MHFRDPRRHLEDVLDAIDKIEEFIGAIDLNAYRADDKTKEAVERKIQPRGLGKRADGIRGIPLPLAPDWLRDIQRDARQKGVNDLTLEEIEAEIAVAGRQRSAKSDCSPDCDCDARRQTPDDTRPTAIRRP